MKILPVVLSITTNAWWTLFSILFMRLVNRRTLRLVRLCIAAAASSGIFILLRLLDCGVGGWMNDCCLLRVPMDGGAASAVFAAVLDLVLDDGCSSSIFMSLSRRRLLSLLIRLAFVLPILTAGLFSPACRVSSVLYISCTLGSDCSVCDDLKSMDLVVGPSIIGEFSSVFNCCFCVGDCFCLYSSS